MCTRREPSRVFRVMQYLDAAVNIYDLGWRVDAGAYRLSVEELDRLLVCGLRCPKNASIPVVVVLFILLPARTTAEYFRYSPSTRYLR